MSAYKTSSVIQAPNAPDPRSSIAKERDNIQFDTIKMHHFLEGSKARSELFLQLTQQMERDPILNTDLKYYDLTKDEQRELTVHKINRLARYIEGDNFSDFQRRLSIVNAFDPQVGTRLGVNLGLFLSCIRGNGTAEQLGYWALSKETAYVKGIYGCFAMTELAHGSNVMGLETTATFDQDTDEFVINTPHIGATKWWIGGAAHSATHTTVYARLIVKGEDYGVKTFVVPLRDANHELNPGISVGDIGSKMGRDGIDNGWIQFSNVRIPRFFMLQKFCKVSKDGEVILPPLEQLSYSALLGGRVIMVLDSFRMAARMTTIAIRYGIGRRQFRPSGQEFEEGVPENQLLDYPLHQKRLLPYLALAYVFSAGAYKVERTIEDTLTLLDDAVDNDDDAGIMKAIEEMKSLFIDSGSLKSTCTWLAAEVIDQCRQSCGGHGYSAYNGFGKAYDDWVVQCTWEGDNNVLGISIGKPIIKHVLAVIDDDKIVKGSSAFLTHTKKYIGDNYKTPILKTAADAADLKLILKALEVAIIRLSYRASESVRKHNFEYVGPESVEITRLKSHHYLLEEFLRRVETTEDKELVPWLTLIGKLYASGIILEKFAATFLTYHVATTDFITEVSSNQLPSLLQEVRPHAVAYTDAFQQSDMMINSAIGRFDGNIYENYFTAVKELNPPRNFKAPYSAALEAMLNRKSLDERNRFEKTDDAAEMLSK
ncbi:acyl-coenzyme a oxidase [Scheffersomyces xylosifermentans]|uniref:acyl-coenzyme a oxidase n=1 Tax=Scheffersomyces xylosifermentans TaxID=1304137 RepID=UPI00315C9E34